MNATSTTKVVFAAALIALAAAVGIQQFQPAPAHTLVIQTTPATATSMAVVHVTAKLTGGKHHASTGRA